MWIWGGKICPEPGECIDNAALEACFIARAFRAGSKIDPEAQRWDVCFSFKFNDVVLRVFRDSTPEEICEQYHNSFRPTTSKQVSG